MYILIIILALVVAMLFVPIKIVAEKKDGFIFYLKILFFKFKFQGAKGKKKKKIKETSADSEKKFSFSVLKRIYGLLADIKEFARFCASHSITVDEIKFFVGFGTGDAAQTGIATGILNSVVYGVMAIIHHNVKLKKWNVDIVPDFKEEKFEYELLCIGTTRLLHIIGMGIKGLKLYKKFRSS